MATNKEKARIERALDDMRMVLTRLLNVNSAAPRLEQRTGDWTDCIAWALSAYENLLALLEGYDPQRARGIGDNDAALLASLREVAA